MDKWFKKEGEKFQSGENLCEISLDDFSVAIDTPRSGILAKVLTRKGEQAEVGDIIASFAIDDESYFKYVESLRIADDESEKIAEVQEIVDESNKKPDTTVLLREIRHLVKSGKISDKGLTRSFCISMTAYKNYTYFCTSAVNFFHSRS